MDGRQAARFLDYEQTTDRKRTRKELRLAELGFVATTCHHEFEFELTSIDGQESCSGFERGFELILYFDIAVFLNAYPINPSCI
jgi:hypothetical protein